MLCLHGIYALALAAPLGVVRIYQAKHSCLCYNLYMSMFNYPLQMEVSEIDFRQWYTSAEDLAEDENRDHYPPRFLTHLKCHQPNTLDVSYMLHVIKDGKTVKEYSFSVFVKASHESNIHIT